MLRKDEPEKFNDSKIESPTDQHPYPNQHDSLDKTNKNRANNIGEGKVKSSQQEASQIIIRPKLKLPTIPKLPNTMTVKLPRINRWWRNWQFWGILLVVCSGGIGLSLIHI